MSEPYAFSAFDLARGYVSFPSDVHMVKAVVDGLYIGTGEGVFFLSGPAPKEFRQVSVSGSRAIAGTDVKIQGRLAFKPNGEPFLDTAIPETGVMWLSESGIFYGGPSGQTVNITQSKIQTIPTGLTGSGLFYDSKYVGLIDP